MTSTITEPAVGAERGAESKAEGKQERRRLRIAAVRAADRSAVRRPGAQARVPESCVPVLARPRVTELIGAAIAAHRVTLVSGPAGAGKTVACAAWATAPPSGTAAAWVSLDSGDRKPAGLWRDVLAALAVAGPGRLAADLPAPSDHEFPQRLAERAGRLSGPLVLVLDDIGELAGTPALAGIDQLIRQGPPQLRLVLAGRHPAGLPVARLRVSGELGEVDGADLACTPEEADGYFRMLGRDVPAAQRDELLKRTLGWITGLRLAAMRTAGRPAAVVSRICGDEPAVADYLWDEVLAGLPPASREFLLRTAVADLVCGDLADTLTGHADATALLDQLARDNMFVQPAGGEKPGWYRYHPLMLDLLRTRLDRELPGQRGPLTRRAARWLAAHGLPAEAIRSAARAADWDFAGRVLSDAGPTMLLPGPAAELEPVLATFPASRFADDVAVAGALAAAGLRTGDTCAAALHLDNAGQALDRCPPAQRERIEPWLTALRLMHGEPGHSAALAGPGRVLAGQAERTASGPGGHQGLGLLWCALGVSELGLADPATARESFAAARRHLADGETAFADRATCWQALADAMNGDLRIAAALLDEVRSGQAAGEAGDPLARLLARLADAYVRLGRDEPAAARAALDDSGAEIHPGGPPGGRLPVGDPLTGQVTAALASCARARAGLAEGDLTAARAPLTRLRYQRLNAAAGRAGQPDAAPAQVTRGDHALDLLLAPVEAEIALRDGDLARARQALGSVAAGRPVLADGSLAAAGRQPATAAIALAWSRLLLAQGDGEAALRGLGPCLRPAAGKPGQATLLEQVSALVMAAVAARRLGQSEPAAGHLTCALALAEPHSLYRPFLDGGPAARSALTVLIRPLSEGAAFAARILQRFEAAAAAPAGQQPASVPLTSSELAVLRFLPSHMTNQEIADALFLSINTVKTHLRSVYRKLGVATRRQAITRGGKLGLL